MNYLFSIWIIPSLETGYLALPEYGGTDLNALKGIWAIVSALVISIAALIFCGRAGAGRRIGDTDSAGNAFRFILEWKIH